jgi:hypothetical protein
VPNIERAVRELRDAGDERKRLVREFDNADNLRRSREAMCHTLQ